MRIGELARRTGVNQRLLRYYEEQGLLTPDRLPSGYRVYADTDVLPCMGVDGERLIASICPELVDDLMTERERISRSISTLQEAQSALDAIIAARPAASSTARPAPAGSR